MPLTESQKGLLNDATERVVEAQLALTKAKQEFTVAKINMDRVAKQQPPPGPALVAWTSVMSGLITTFNTKKAILASREEELILVQAALDVLQKEINDVLKAEAEAAMAAAEAEKALAEAEKEKAEAEALKDPDIVQTKADLEIELEREATKREEQEEKAKTTRQIATYAIIGVIALIITIIVVRKL